MTQAALAAALSAVEEVRNYVAISERRIDAVRQLLELDPPLEGVSADWVREIAAFREGRKFDYVCAVVLLYGAYERFVEDATEEYLAALARSASHYSELPEKLRAAHFTQVLAHLQRTRDARYDGRASAQQLASAFSGCLQDVVPFEFLTESMLHHTANFRPSVVDDFLGRIGIDGASRRAVGSEVFGAYVETSGKAIPDDRPEAVLDLVGELISRRNEVAHGDVSNTLAPSELLPYCDQVAAYCSGLAVVLDSSLLEQLIRFYGIDHGRPLAVYNHNVVCIQSQGAVIAVGDILAIQRADASWYSTKILSIQIDGVEVTSTKAGVDVAVGLGIDGRCKETYSIRTGVFRSHQRPVSTGSSPLNSSAGSTAEASTADVEVWTRRRDEAHTWLLRNGEGPNAGWLKAEYDRCCDGLEAAKRESS